MSINAEWINKKHTAAITSQAETGITPLISRQHHGVMLPLKRKTQNPSYKKASYHLSKTNRSLLANTPLLADALPVSLNIHKLNPLSEKNTLDISNNIDTHLPSPANNKVESKARRIIKNKKGSLFSFRKSRIMNQSSHTNLYDFNRSQKIYHNLNTITNGQFILQKNTNEHKTYVYPSKPKYSIILHKKYNFNQFTKPSVSYSEMESIIDVSRTHQANKNNSVIFSKRGKTEFGDIPKSDTQPLKHCNLIKSTNKLQDTENQFKLYIKKISIPLLLKSPYKRKNAIQKCKKADKLLTCINKSLSVSLKKGLSSNATILASKKLDKLSVIDIKTVYAKVKVSKREDIKLLPQLSIKDAIIAKLSYFAPMFVNYATPQI